MHMFFRTAILTNSSFVLPKKKTKAQNGELVDLDIIDSLFPANHMIKKHQYHTYYILMSLAHTNYSQQSSNSKSSPEISKCSAYFFRVSVKGRGKNRTLDGITNPTPANGT